jgi:spermidine/putrescine transport system substrate-binding protein
MNDIKDLEAVKAKLKALMPQIKTFWSSENDWNQFFSAGDFTVSTFWSGGAGRSPPRACPWPSLCPRKVRSAGLTA